jgi:Periplasmic serine proteases (ClpP class)
VEYVRSLADGRIFTGRQAHSLRLVDELGGLEDAIMLAGRLAGIPGRPRVITLRRQPTLSERLLQLYLPALDGLIDPSHGDVIRWLGVPPWGYRLR